jgi:hypothetical protein
VATVARRQAAALAGNACGRYQFAGGWLAGRLAAWQQAAEMDMLLVMCCLESAAGPMLKYGVSCRQKGTCAHAGEDCAHDRGGCCGGKHVHPRCVGRTRTARRTALHPHTPKSQGREVRARLSGGPLKVNRKREGASCANYRGWRQSRHRAAVLLPFYDECEFDLILTQPAASPVSPAGPWKMYTCVRNPTQYTASVLLSSSLVQWVNRGADGPSPSVRETSRRAGRRAGDI